MRFALPFRRVMVHAQGDALLLVLAGVTAAGYLTGTALLTQYGTSLVKGDARGYFSYLPSLVFDRDLELGNQFETLEPEGKALYPYGKGPQGRPANPFPVVPAILWLPGYLCGVGVELVMPALRWGRPLGYGAAAVWGAATAAILFAALGAVLTRRLIGDAIGPRDATVVVLATWLGTAALYYTLVTPLYAHAVSWFGAAAMLYTTARASVHPLTPSRWFVAGLFGGVMVAIRLLDASLLIVPVFMLVIGGQLFGSSWNAAARSGLAWLPGVALGYLPQALTSYHLYGKPAPSTPFELGKAFHPFVMREALFSTRYEGWFSWTPLVVLALIGLVWMLRRTNSASVRLLAAASILGVVGLYVMDVLHPYARPGAAFGARRYVSASPFVALGIAGVLAATARQPKLRGGVLALVAICVMWNMWLLVSYERLVHVHHTYPTLSQTAGFALGFGVP